MEGEADDGGHGGAGECGITGARAAHVLKGALELLRDRLLVDAFEHGLRADLQQLGDAVERAAFNAHPVQLPWFTRHRTVRMRMVTVHPDEGTGAGLMTFARDLHPAVTLEAED